MDIEQIDRYCDRFERRLKSGEEVTVQRFLKENQLAQDDGLIEELRKLENEYAGDNAITMSGASPTSSQIAEIDRTTEPAPIQSSSHEIGKYKLLQPIGKGGMGTVYMAEQQEPVRRRVALKLIKTETPTKEILARFEAERQALAMMDHQNIAKVLDAGVTADGRPYFAMELVKGIPITRYCDKNKLTTSERLNLFGQCCRAIQHAHQKGIIHRDIKPSNILVTLYDGRPMAKVIDFGLAKALQDTTPLTSRTLFTHFGQVVGTLQYMSPEQAETNALDVDTRTDVYSLGVILYELLTGSTPIDHERMQSEALDRILRLIREEEPPRPSTRVSESGDAITSISEQRRSNPKKLSLMLRGELDCIAMKALEKDRSRRYDGAAALADDVERYLQDEPVKARPPSFGYRFGKTFRKHKVGITTAVGVLGILVAGLLGTGTMWLRSERFSKNNAQLAREKTDEAKKAQDALKAKQAALLAERAQHQRAEWKLYSSQLNSALREWQAGHVELAREYLTSCRGELRGWEHDYVNALFQTGLLASIKSDHSRSGVTAISPLGKRFAHASTGGKITVWDVESKRVLLSTDGDRKTYPIPACLAFSLDANRLACGWGGGAGASALDIYDLESDGLLLTLNSKDVGDIMRDVAFHPNGNHLAIAGINRGPSLWDLQKESKIEAFQLTRGKRERAFEVALAIDGKLMLSRDVSTVILRNTESGRQFSLIDHEGLSAAALSPDGERVVTGGRDGTLRTWDARSGQLLRTLAESEQAIGCLAYSPDGTQIITAGNTVRVHDSDTGRLLNEFQGHVERVTSVRWGAAGRTVYSSSGDGVLNIWQSARTNHTIASADKGAFRPDQLNDVVFSPNGNRIITAAFQGVRVWSLASGREVRTLYNHDLPLTCLAVSRDGQRIVGGGIGGRLTIWDAANGYEIASFQDSDTSDPSGNSERTKSPIMSVAIDPHGEQIARLSRESELTLHDGSTGSMIHRLELRANESIADIIYCDDGRRLVSVGSSGITIWDTRSGSRDRTVQAGPSEILSVASSADGNRMATGSDDGTIKLWDTEGYSEVQSIEGHTGGVASIAFSPDSAQLVSLSDSGSLKIWDSVTGQCKRTLSAADQALPGWRWVSFCLDGKRIVETGRNAIRIRDTLSGELTRAVEQDPTPMTLPAALHDDKRLITSPFQIGLFAGRHQRVRVWSPETMTEESYLQMNLEHVRCLAGSADRTVIASANTDGRVTIWDSVSGLAGRVIEVGADRVSSLAVSQHGSEIVVARESGAIDVWSAETGEKTKVLPGHESAVHCVSISHDDKWIASGGEDATVRIWDAREGDPQQIMNGHSGPVHCLSFSPDGRVIVSGSGDRTLRFWDVGSASEIRIAYSKKTAIHSVCFTPGGERVATGNANGTITFWETSRGIDTLTLAEHESEVRSIEFTPDGNHLISGSRDGIVRILTAHRDLTTSREAEK